MVMSNKISYQLKIVKLFSQIWQYLGHSVVFLMLLVVFFVRLSKWFCFNSRNCIQCVKEMFKGKLACAICIEQGKKGLH